MYNQKLKELYPNKQLQEAIYDLARFCEKCVVPCWLVDPQEVDLADGSGLITVPTYIVLLDRLTIQSAYKELANRLMDLIGEDGYANILLVDTNIPGFIDMLSRGESLWD